MSIFDALSQIPSDLLQGIVSLPKDTLQGLAGALMGPAGITSAQYAAPGGNAPAPQAQPAPAPAAAPAPQVTTGTGSMQLGRDGSLTPQIPTQVASTPVPMARPGMAIPQVAPDAGQPSPLPAPAGPTGLKAPLSGLPSVLDRIVLGGAVEANREQQNLFLAQQYQMQQLGNYAATLPPAQRALFLASVPDYLKSATANVDVKAGDSTIGPAAAAATGGGPYTAPVMGVDQPSGVGFTQTPGGITPTGQFGGDVKTENGIVYSTRTGPMGTYSTPQKLAPGESPSAFTPTVRVGGFMVPQVGQEPPPAPQAAPSAVDPAVAASLKSAIIGQESGGNPGVAPSAQGAIGIGQVRPATFAQYARPGESITNPADNLAVSGRILDDYLARYRDPVRAAVAYFSGPNNVAPPNSATPWLRNTKDATGTSVADYVANVQRRMASSANPASASGVTAAPGWTVGAPAGASYRIVDGSQVAGGKPGERYKIAPNGDVTPIGGAGTFDPAMMATRGQEFMGSDDYKGAANSVAAVNGLARAIETVPKGTPLAMGTFDTFMRSINPSMGVRTGMMRTFMDELGAPQELTSQLQKLENGNFIPQNVAKQMLGVAYAYAERHLTALQQRHVADVKYATDHGFSENDLGESMPTLSPFPLSDRPKPGDLVTGRIYQTPKGVGRWNGGSFDRVQ